MEQGGHKGVFHGVGKALVFLFATSALAGCAFTPEQKKMVDEDTKRFDDARFQTSDPVFYYGSDTICYTLKSKFPGIKNVYSACVDHSGPVAQVQPFRRVY